MKYFCKKIILNIAIFASGTGSNAEKIIEYFSNNEQIKVSLLISNKSEAAVLAIADKNNITTKVFSKSDFENIQLIIDYLKKHSIHFIVLAGFLLKVPVELIQAFPNKILNIHPSLLPKYGGKGMYGKFVHQVVLDNNETESGISIHLVNENFDEGKIIHQSKVQLSNNETIDSLSKKIQQLEHSIYPKVIEDFITSFNK